MKRTKSERTRSDNKNLMHSILSSALPAREKDAERIAQEAFGVFVAGSETSARILTNAVYYVLNNKKRVLAKMKEELLQAMPLERDRPNLSVLERLPWLVSLGESIARTRD